MTWWPVPESRLPGRLVGQQDRGLVRQRARDRDALLLAAGELRRIVMAARAEADFRQQRVGPRARIRRAGDLERHAHVLPRGERRQQVEELEDEADALAAEPREIVFRHRRDVGAVDDDAPGRRRVEPGEQPEQRRLAAARRAGDRDDAGRSRCADPADAGS